MADDWEKQLTPPPPPPGPPSSTCHTSERWSDIPVEETMHSVSAASSAAPISSGFAAEVGVVEGNRGTATPVVGLVMTKLRSVDFPEFAAVDVEELSQEPSEDEENLVTPHSSTKYTCEGICRDDDGYPCEYERSVLNIVGYRLKPDGPYVPGATWQGCSNRLCMECYIEKYMADESAEEIEEVRQTWKRTCKQSHRKADKYNHRKKQKAQEDRGDKIRKLSVQQQERCNRWAAAKRDILEAHPGAANREFRNLTLHRVQSMVTSIRNSLSLLDEEGIKMLEEAREARVAHLTKLAETGVCDNPDGKVLTDYTLQFLSDLTPDGKNKELFLCRGCGFVHMNHQWHQAKGEYGEKHHFRCRRCNRLYEPWKKDSRFCNFNKVLVNQDPHDNTKLIATPAWWEQTSEQAFVNILKECVLKMKLGAEEMNQVTYTNITKVISEKVYSNYSQPTMFEMVDVPAPIREQVAYLSNCKGYEHCDTSPQKIEGFFIENFMDITDDQIFRDFEVLCNELAHCFKMDDA